jgi:hypothetical protein
MTPAHVLAVQRCAGNRAARGLVQARLTVGPARDRYEQEADRVAEQVMSAPGSVSAQPELQRAGEMIVQCYADIPSKKNWVADSALFWHRRSKELRDIDEAVGAWPEAATSPDLTVRGDALRNILTMIERWRASKPEAGASSKRAEHIDDLQAVVEKKLGQMQIGIALGAAAGSGNLEDAQLFARRLAEDSLPAYLDIVQALMTGAGSARWLTIFFTAPATAVNFDPITPASLRAHNDYSGMTQALADFIIHDFFPSLLSDRTVALLQVREFRAALRTEATPEVFQELVASMPLLRITETVEAGIGSAAVTETNIDDVTQAIFNAFLGDLSQSNLRYFSNTGINVAQFLAGKALDPKAPCMTLSNIFKELLTAFEAQRFLQPEGRDGNALLTKPLPDIGNKGVLTRDTSFAGNVKQYMDQVGFENIRRVFFGDGHIWINVHNREYDPTLGISGPKGTVPGTVEKVFKKGEHGTFTSGTLVAHRTAEEPPGGKALGFERTVFIESGRIVAGGHRRPSLGAHRQD